MYVCMSVCVCVCVRVYRTKKINNSAFIKFTSVYSHKNLMFYKRLLYQNNANTKKNANEFFKFTTSSKQVTFQRAKGNLIHHLFL